MMGIIEKNMKLAEHRAEPPPAVAPPPVVNEAPAEPPVALPVPDTSAPERAAQRPSGIAGALLVLGPPLIFPWAVIGVLQAVLPGAYNGPGGAVPGITTYIAVWVISYLVIKRLAKNKRDSLKNKS
jgi:hypothetical protein